MYIVEYLYKLPPDADDPVYPGHWSKGLFQAAVRWMYAMQWAGEPLVASSIQWSKKKEFTLQTRQLPVRTWRDSDSGSGKSVFSYYIRNFGIPQHKVSYFLVFLERPISRDITD